ncbi:MAG: sulfide dehydrogenase (flavocytochrome), flavoprotein subunit [Betaproteobacteria bacterium]|nr:sulfide dehydrogenase (flavocytochrome), flavoprotein subunit [Betaproteobacteria bacterium]
MQTRRDFLKAGSAAGALAAASYAAPARAQSVGRVVVVGGGYGGATAARYLRLWSEGRIEVTLVEREPAFVSCPLSALVVGGSKRIEDITVGYEGLARLGVKVIRGEATEVDAEKKTVVLQSGQKLPYDRLVLSPGIDFIPGEVAGLDDPKAFDTVPHAWHAGPQTVLLRRQLEAMKDGGVYVITIPLAPYRCSPAPYERVCQVAWYFQKRKPKSKIIVLDANEEIQAEKALFQAVWNGPYKGMIEYRPSNDVKEVDVATRTTVTDLGDKQQADVLNVIPPQRAGAIAGKAGVISVNQRWCQVDWLTLESVVRPGIHVLGDSAFPASVMPKSGHMANQHAKTAAAAIIELMSGRAPNPAPMMSNTCYSFVDDKRVIHVTSTHAYDAAEKTMKAVPGSGGTSATASELEGRYGFAWARNIWADMLG